MYKGSNCDRKSQLSEILTEPLNPCVSEVNQKLQALTLKLMRSLPSSY